MFIYQVNQRKLRFFRYSQLLRSCSLWLFVPCLWQKNRCGNRCENLSYSLVGRPILTDTIDQSLFCLESYQ